MPFEPIYDECQDCPCYVKVGCQPGYTHRCLCAEGTCDPPVGCPEFDDEPDELE